MTEVNDFVRRMAAATNEEERSRIIFAQEAADAAAAAAPKARATKAAAPVTPQQKKLLFQCKREDGRVVTVDLMKTRRSILELVDKRINNEMDAFAEVIKDVLMPRLRALEADNKAQAADNKALTDMVSELESKIAILEKRP